MFVDYYSQIRGGGREALSSSAAACRFAGEGAGPWLRRRLLLLADSQGRMVSLVVAIEPGNVKRNDFEEQFSSEDACSTLFSDEQPPTFHCCAVMDGMFEFHFTPDYGDRALMSPENLMDYGYSYHGLISSFAPDWISVFGSDNLIATGSFPCSVGGDRRENAAGEKEDDDGSNMKIKKNNNGREDQNG
nr:homeobox protein knotted-1-like 6 [Ipomoea batatas]